jgi:hypothetical protein
MDGIACTLRVIASDDPNVARVFVRRRQFTVGRPIEFDDRALDVSALEYALGALGGEVVNGLRAFAWRRRLELDRVEALVTGELEHGLSYLEVVGEGGEPRLARVLVKTFVAAADEAAVRRLWDDLVRRLPLVCTLGAAVRLDLELIVTA